ncbi:hypothetical protein C0991_003925 [Blastosporella zonata]|nr:hypothetical protein C0991_003925 [Blastosporella zonata]
MSLTASSPGRSSIPVRSATSKVASTNMSKKVIGPGPARIPVNNATEPSPRPGLARNSVIRSLPRIPRIKKNTQLANQRVEETFSYQSSSSSSTYPWSTPSDTPSVPPDAINRATRQNYAAVEAINSDGPTIDPVPSNRINLSQPAPSTAFQTSEPPTFQTNEPSIASQLEAFKEVTRQVRNLLDTVKALQSQRQTVTQVDPSSTLGEVPTGVWMLVSNNVGHSYFMA